jgi:hypothetical protein
VRGVFFIYLGREDKEGGGFSANNMSPILLDFNPLLYLKSISHSNSYNERGGKTFLLYPTTNANSAPRH